MFVFPFRRPNASSPFVRPAPPLPANAVQPVHYTYRTNIFARRAMRGDRPTMPHNAFEIPPHILAIIDQHRADGTLPVVPFDPEG